MNFPRASGILLHPTSLPSPFGIGDFGEAAYKFVDFLGRAGQTYWQILPLGPTGYGDSPYQAFSAFAGNTNLISPEILVGDGLLTSDEIYQKPDFPPDRVDYGLLYEWKNWILNLAHDRFSQTAVDDLRGEFENFTQTEGAWLEDYALFRAVKKSQDQKLWLEWDEPLRLRDENALNEARENLRGEIQTQKFRQWLFFRQWNDLKIYANENNIKIVGDVPIFISLDSADVWCRPHEFKLDEQHRPQVLAGVPPDYFSKTGQLWGNPIYDWETMKQNNFGWWIERIKATLKWVDIIRVDHFRGFAAAWEIPFGDKTAENGQWVDAAGRELFEAIGNELGELPFWAEDLGVITPDVEELRDLFDFPGMRILQYGFGGNAENRDLPHNYIRNCVAYTGTHDNDTICGWFASRKKSPDKHELEFCLKYLASDGADIHWDFVRAAWSSIADTTIAPMQDLLGLGNRARMNFPSSSAGNWAWQCAENCFSDEIADRLRELTEIYGRKNGAK